MRCLGYIQEEKTSYIVRYVSRNLKAVLEPNLVELSTYGYIEIELVEIA